MLALAGTIPNDGDEATPPTAVVATVDFESGDIEADLPALRVGRSMPLVHSRGERHEGTLSVHPASRIPTPPDRPPRLV